MDGEIRDASEGGYQLVAPLRFLPGTPLRIDLADAMVLAEVKYCISAPDTPGVFLVGLESQAILRGLSDLARLMRAFLPESQTATPVETGQPARSSPMLFLP